MKSTGSIEVDYVSASLGSVNNDLITAIYYAAQGDDGLKEYSQRAERGKKAKTTSAEDALGQINNHFRIYFPSRQTVDESRGGREVSQVLSDATYICPTLMVCRPRELYVLSLSGTTRSHSRDN